MVVFRDRSAPAGRVHRCFHRAMVCLFGALWLAAAVSRAQERLQINEIMYTPASGQAEWVELHNPGSGPVDLYGWIFKDATAAMPQIANAPFLVPAGGYVVIAKDSSVSREYSPSVFLLCAMPKFPSLNNTGDDLSLLRRDSTLADIVRYKAAWGGQGGRSLERLNPLHPGDQAGNWTSSTGGALATPGARNSVAALDSDLAIRSAAISGSDAIVLVANIGLTSAAGAELELSLDRDLDGVATPGELLSRVPVRTLGPDDSELVVFPGVTLGGGYLRFIARLVYSSDERNSDNTRVFDSRVTLERGALATNEIMFDPLAGDAEWVEFVNTTASAIDVEGLRIASAPGSDGKRTSRTLTHVPGPVRAGAFLVVTTDSSIFARFPELRIPDPTRVIVVLAGGSLALSNTADEVTLIDPGGSSIDSVRYNASWHNPNVPSTSGRSLERLNPAFPAGLPSNWSSCAAPAGGTPGSRNSLYTARPPLVAGGSAALTFDPNPFSPDGDGFEDACVIGYTLPWNVAQVRLRIFDSEGRMRRSILSNAPSGASGQVLWDGRDDEGRRLRIGMYVVLLEASDLRLIEVGSVKGVLVLATRL